MGKSLRVVTEARGNPAEATNTFTLKEAIAELPGDAQGLLVPGSGLGVVADTRGDSAEPVYAFALEGSVAVGSAKVTQKLPLGELPITTQIPERREIRNELAMLYWLIVRGEVVEGQEQIGVVSLDAIEGRCPVALFGAVAGQLSEER